MMLKSSSHICIPTPAAPLRDGTPCYACASLRTSIRADTLRAPLPPPRRWNPSCAPPLPCCGRSVHPRVPAVHGLSSARNPCPRPPSSRENPASLHPTWVQNQGQPALHPPALPEQQSLTIRPRPPCHPQWQPLTP